MATELEYALLSGNIYQRTVRNLDGTFNANYFQLVPEPEGWSVGPSSFRVETNGDNRWWS